MTLFLDNAVVSDVLTMADTIGALERAYRQLSTGEAVCRPRIDVHVPIDPDGPSYRWGTMEGGSADGYFAIRMKSDMLYEVEKNGVRTEEKYCVRPGLYCGLVLLMSARNGEPLAFINDGVLQHMRVGADGAIGVRYMSREDSHVLGMLGSGGMARSHMEALMCVRDITRLQVYSPTPANRDRFGDEVRDRYGIEVAVCDRPEDVYRGADIVAGLTDAAAPVLDGALLEPGTHVINVGAGGRPDEATVARLDTYLRFGTAPAPLGRPELGLDDEYLTFSAQPPGHPGIDVRSAKARGHGLIAPDRVVYLEEILDGRKKGRSGADQITYSERGNLQGLQFWAVAAVVYEKAKAQGLGHEIPTDWLLQDIRD